MKPGDDAGWALVFLTLGILILIFNTPRTPNTGWVILIGAGACAVGLVFTYRTILNRKGRR